MGRNNQFSILLYISNFDELTQKSIISKKRHSLILSTLSNDFLKYNFFFHFSNTILYVKFLILWVIVIAADFMLEFRFEYLWPFWLLLRSVHDSFKYKGLVS